MTFPFINHSATASLPGGGAHTSLAVSLTADNDNEVVLILVTFSLKSGSTPTVTGITGGGLTFAQHAAPTPLSSSIQGVTMASRPVTSLSRGVI